MKRQTTILSIDDDVQICYALNELFRYQGWRTLTAHDVPSGLARFREEKPDIVLIDYHMPGISGIRGIELLRALSPEVPIIVFTIDEAQEAADRFLAAGASDIALKPIKAPDIVSRIKVHLRLLENSRGAEMPQDSVKGISAGTLALIESYLRHSGAFYDVADIALGTGLAEQTVYRYLQHLAFLKRVEVQISYGKAGRPKQHYRAAVPPSASTGNVSARQK